MKVTVGLNTSQGCTEADGFQQHSKKEANKQRFPPFSKIPTSLSHISPVRSLAKRCRSYGQRQISDNECESACHQASPLYDCADIIANDCALTCAYFLIVSLLASLCAGYGVIFKDGSAMDLGKNNSTTTKVDNENKASCLFSYSYVCVDVCTYVDNICLNEYVFPSSCYLHLKTKLMYACMAILCHYGQHRRKRNRSGRARHGTADAIYSNPNLNAESALWCRSHRKLIGPLR